MNQGRYTTKRADLTTYTVLFMVGLYGSSAYEELIAWDWPGKVVIRAFERDTARGLLDWGVSPARPFLTPEGQRRLIAQV